MFGRFALIAGILLATAGVASAEALSGAEIKALLAGKSAKWQSADGKVKGTTAWAADGGAVVTGNFGDFDKDSGTWRVKGDTYCAKWQRIRKGKEACFPFEVMGNGRYKVGTSVVQF